MRKTIQREQNRIRMLNQGLQNIAFGQVKSVRLVVNIRDTHAMLLDALSGKQEDIKIYSVITVLPSLKPLRNFINALTRILIWGNAQHKLSVKNY